MLKSSYYYNGSSTGTLYYELLDVSVAELEIKRSLKVYVADRQRKEQVSNRVID
jgi:hypothetical protein